VSQLYARAATGNQQEQPHCGHCCAAEAGVPGPAPGHRCGQDRPKRCPSARVPALCPPAVAQFRAHSHAAV